MDYQLWLLTKSIFLKEKEIAAVRAMLHGEAPALPTAQGFCPTVPPAQPSLAALRGGTQVMAAGQELTHSTSQHL